MWSRQIIYHGILPLVLGEFLILVDCQVNLRDHFSKCDKGEETFDNCIKSRLNDLRPFYKSGLPQYGIGSFDPFFAPQIPQKRNGQLFNYKLMLKNVTESGWTVSEITDLNSARYDFLVCSTVDAWTAQGNSKVVCAGGINGPALTNSATCNISLSHWDGTEFGITTTLLRVPELIFYHNSISVTNDEIYWTDRTDANRNSITYTQFFPDKKLNGGYDIEGTFLGSKVVNNGSWNLSLYDFVQTTTITRKTARDVNGKVVPHSPLKVEVNIQTCKKLELHIGHLAGGRTAVENMLDWIINTAWQPGFVVLSPLINDLVSTAFTEIFNKNFQNFPFDEIFPD